MDRNTMRYKATEKELVDYITEHRAKIVPLWKEVRDLHDEIADLEFEIGLYRERMYEAVQELERRNEEGE